MKDKFSFEDIIMFHSWKKDHGSFIDKYFEIMFFRKYKIILNWGW